MADQQENVDQGAVEKRAMAMGWIPKDQFRGDISRWRDAATYLERGEELLPIVQANNRKLIDEVGQLRGQLSETVKLLSAATESIEALKEFNSTANITQVKEKKTEILTALKQAKKDEDVDREVELQDQLVNVNAALTEAEKKPVVKAKPAASEQQPLDPVFKAWAAENAWFGTDRRKTALANGIADELRANGNTTVGREFLDTLSEEVEKVFGGGRAASSRVEGSNNSGEGGGGGGGGKKPKTFASLPAEAKTACEKLAPRLVGKGKAYKDLAEWQTAYTKKYLESEA